MTDQRRRRNWIWLLLLAAVVLVWWLWKPPADNGRAVDGDDGLAAAQLGDPDDVLVDLVDSLSDAEVAEIERQYGVDLVLVSDQSHDEQFYRAHVDAAKRDALLAALGADGRVEVAEPDAVYSLDESIRRICSPDKPHCNRRLCPPDRPLCNQELEPYPAISSMNAATHPSQFPMTATCRAGARATYADELRALEMKESELHAERETMPEVTAERVALDAKIAAATQKCVQRAAALDQDPAFAGFPNDPQYKFQWHLRQIGMPAAWPHARTEGVIVAVIDTGVAYENYRDFHMVPDLAGVTFVKPYDFVNNTPHANDDHGHGTHVAGTIGQATHNGIGVSGVAPGVQIMPLKVLGASGSGSTAGIADAIRYAADNGAKVINMSLGGGMRSKILERAVKYAHGKGVIVIAAAGNDGRDRVSYPAAYPFAVAVAATQFDETTTFYSNRGAQIDVAAPGGNTKVDQNGDGMPDGVLQNTIQVGNPKVSGYYPFMGTSMAAPHVAGVAALIVGAGVTDPDQVEAILKSSARAPKDTASFDAKRYGAGIVDVPAALAQAQSGTAAAQLGLGVVLALVVGFMARAGSLSGRLPGYAGGVLVGSAGLLFFLPMLGELGAHMSQWPVLSALTRGLPSWGLATFGPTAYANPLTMSALVPLAAIGFGLGVARLRPLLAGLAVGVAAHLVFHAAAGVTDVRWMVADGVWLMANAALLTAVAILTLRR